MNTVVLSLLLLFLPSLFSIALHLSHKLRTRIVGCGHRGARTPKARGRVRRGDELSDGRGVAGVVPQFDRREHASLHCATVECGSVCKRDGCIRVEHMFR